MNDQTKKQNWGDIEGTSDEEEQEVEQTKKKETKKEETKKENEQEGENQEQVEEEEKPKYSYNKTGQQQQERKKLPNKYEMIDEIKQQDSNEVVLSIFNVHYNADAKLIQEVFHEFNFKNIHNYRKGMFAIYFTERQEAIKFIKASPRPLLGRNFIVKISEKNTKKKEDEFTQIGFGNKPLHYQERGGNKNFDSKPRYPNNNFNRKLNTEDEPLNGAEGAFFKRERQETTQINDVSDQGYFKRSSNPGYNKEGGHNKEGGYKNYRKQSGDQQGETNENPPNVGFFKGGDRKDSKRDSEQAEKSNPFGKARAIDDKDVKDKLVVLKKRESETLQEQAKTEEKIEKPVVAKKSAEITKKVEDVKVEKVVAEPVQQKKENFVQREQREQREQKQNKRDSYQNQDNNQKRDSYQQRNSDNKFGNRDNKDRKQNENNDRNEIKGNRKQDNEKKQEKKQEKQEDDEWKVAGQKPKPVVDDEWQVVGQKQKREKRGQGGNKGAKGEDKQKGNNYETLE